MHAPIQFFNTLSRSKEPFTPQGEVVKLYTCGPTVYDYAHIGNLRTYVFEDLLKRTLIYFGYKVKHIMNITDIDDKTIKGAISKKISLLEYTSKFRKAFFNDLKALNILLADAYPNATDHIPEMIEMITSLKEKGYAYKGADQSIYFSIKKFEKYGKLSHLKLNELQTGASKRVSSDEYDKDNASDFVLWKNYDKERDGKIFWESPFGKGRPGWHIECSAMATKYLGEKIDIHMGGVDNIFPHHENEIAQSECCFDKAFCPMWVHCEHLIVDGKKMSKSLGNFYTLRSLIEDGYDGKVVRYLLLQTHYKTQLNFTLEGLKAAKNSIDRIHNFIARLKRVDVEPIKDRECISLISYKKAFQNALLDDLNISVALSVIFEMIRNINPLLDQKTVDKSSAEKILDFLEELNSVLAIMEFSSNEKIPQELLESAKLRQEARANKNWTEADRLRDLILEKGYLIEDTPKGPLLKKKS